MTVGPYTNKVVIEAIEKSIEHWKRMIDWVKNLPLKLYEDLPVAAFMGNRLGEHWKASDCTLCTLFIGNGCRGCPISGCGTCGSPGHAWAAVNGSETWVKWLEAASTQMLPALQFALAHARKIAQNEERYAEYKKKKTAALERINRGDITRHEFEWLRQRRTRFINNISDPHDGDRYILVGSGMDNAQFVNAEDRGWWSCREGAKRAFELKEMYLEILPEGFPID